MFLSAVRLLESRNLNPTTTADVRNKATIGVVGSGPTDIKVILTDRTGETEAVGGSGFRPISHSILNRDFELIRLCNQYAPQKGSFRIKETG